MQNFVSAGLTLLLSTQIILTAPSKTPDEHDAWRKAVPVGDPATSVKIEDLPFEALPALKSRGYLLIELGLDVTPSGVPSACRIIQTSGVIALDRRACSVMMSRSHFVQQINAKGEPEATFYRAGFGWTFPQAPNYLIAFDQSATPVDCTLFVAGKARIVKADICANWAMTIKGYKGELPAFTTITFGKTDPLRFVVERPLDARSDIP